MTKLEKLYSIIGLEHIPAVGIQHGNGYNLVSKDKRPTMPGRIWQHVSLAVFLWKARNIERR